MSYQEFSPPPALARHVRLIWQYQSQTHVSDGPGEPLQRIVPDGHPELILHFAQPYAEVDPEGTAVPQVQALFAGQLTRPLLLQQAPRAGVLGIRFRPAAARAFFAQPMQTLTDRRVALAALWGELPAYDLLEACVASEPYTRVAQVSNVLIRRLSASPTPMDLQIDHCAERLLTPAASAEVDALAAYCNVSRRQFERRFLAEVGISPRLLASIARFRTLFDALERDTLRVRHWAEAAQIAGYFDQAHMNREFKRFAGLSPQLFCQTLGGLSAAMVGAESP